MLIRFPAAARVQACWRRSSCIPLIARAFHGKYSGGGIAPVGEQQPPRAAAYARTRHHHHHQQQPALQALLTFPTRKMSSNGFSSAAAEAAASPAPAASTSPGPGSSPSQPAPAPATAGAAGGQGGGAAPAPPQQHQANRADAQPTVEEDDSTSSPNGNAKEGEEQSGQEAREKGKPLPALPAPDAASGEGPDGVRTVMVNGQPVALDALGPMVVNRDGTVSRIANWPEMTEIERENTLRILCKRNQLRLGNLRAGRPADAPQEGSS
ncbi:hypothetical protein VTH82DRAFT_303 [Thermothelomyces myriococcoides]